MSAESLLLTNLSFGEWLRRRRGVLGLTQAELVQQLNCAIITLRKFESEERRPSPEMALRMAVVLQLPADQHDVFVRFARGELRAGERLSVDEVNGPPDIPQASPAAKPEDTRFHLPIPPYAIIGRERMIAQASDLLTQGQARVLTLVGPPGVGKTRLGLELAHRLHGGFADGAVFVELASVQESSLVPAAVAEALRLEDSTSADTTAAVLAALRDRHMLLVLDNFEHVINAASFVAELVSRCAKLVCLVTSRERLRIRAEHALPVNVLAVPSAETVTLDVVQASPAARLFITRATEANAQLQLTQADAPAIAELCAQLEGLPLALELLAAQADLFRPVELLADLQRGLSALEDGPRDLPLRHRGLRAATDWSLRLLNENQRTLFAHLAVFAKGFDAEAVQAVFAHRPADLVVLAHASLIQPLGAERWHVIEPIRQVAEEVLAHTNATAVQEARARHAAHFAGVAQTARDELLGPQAERWTLRVEADHANLQAALRWALSTQNAELALNIGQGIFRFWHRRGMWREALGWLEAGLKLDSAAHASLDVRVKAVRAAGYLAQTLGQYDRAEQHFLNSRQLAYRLEDSEQVAAAYVGLGNLYKEQGRFEEALACFDEAIPLEPEHARKFPWQSKADTLLRLGRLDEAEVLYEEAMALNKRIGDDEGLAHTTYGLGEIAWRRGDADAAARYFHANETLYRRLNHTIGLSWTAQHLGNAACVRGAWSEAAAYYAEALTQMNRMGNQRGVCEVLASCAQWAVATRRYDIAAQWIGMAQAGFRALNVKLTPYESSFIEASHQQCAAQLQADALAQALERGAQSWRAGDVAQVIAVLVAGN